MANPNLNNIFLLEDDPDDAEWFCEAMELYAPHLKITVYRDSREVLALLASLTPEEIPAGILMDFRLPHYNGLQLLTWLQSQRHLAPVPLFVWSTNRAELIEETCLKNGATHVFQKPVNKPQFKHIIEHIVDALP